MEERNKDELQELEAEKDSVEAEKEDQIPAAGRRFIIWVLGGVYLLYTGYSLCKNVLDGAEGATTGFFVAGIIFAVIGAGLLLFSAKSMWDEDKKKKAMAAETEKLQNESLTKTETSSDTTYEKKSMSISERANLAQRLAENEEQELE